MKLTIENIILKTGLFCLVIRIDHRRPVAEVGNAEDSRPVFKQEEGQEVAAGKHIV